MAYLATRGRCWSVGSSSNGGRRDHDHHRDLLPSDGGRSSKSWTTRSRDHRTAGDGAPWWWIEWLSIAIWRPWWRVIVTIHLTRRAPSDGADKARKNPRIAVWSSHDRTSFAAESLLTDSTMIDGNLGPRSNLNRGPIVARSWCFWEEIGAKSTAEFRQNHRGIEAASSPSGTAPMTLAKRLHNRSNDPRSSGQFLFKKHVFSLLCS